METLASTNYGNEQIIATEKDFSDTEILYGWIIEIMNSESTLTDEGKAYIKNEIGYKKFIDEFSEKNPEMATDEDFESLCAAIFK